MGERRESVSPSGGLGPLGVLIPGARPDGSTATQGIEIYRLNDWLARLGCDGVAAVNALTTTEGSHTVGRAMEETGGDQAILPVARGLAEQGCTALLWACTCGSFAGGLEWANRQVGAIERSTGLPATSTALAMVKALRAMGARTVDILSPYPAGLSTRFVGFLEEAGLDVAAMSALDCIGPVQSNALDIGAELRRFDRGLPARDHPVLIPDTAVDSLDLLAALEAELGRPVISANQASLWAGLALLGAEPRAAGMGRLFALPVEAGAVPAG